MDPRTRRFRNRLKGAVRSIVSSLSLLTGRKAGGAGHSKSTQRLERREAIEAPPKTV
jgi:hypothetical protein